MANNAKNSIARLGKQESRYSAFAISAATDGDSIGKLRRSNSFKNANNTVRAEFSKTIAQMFGGAGRIPENVLSAMNMKDYERGKPLTADRILDVYSAIKDYIKAQKDEALRGGTLKAIEVADTVADKFLDQFKAKCNPPPSAVAASNLKRTLLLCATNIMNDGAVKGGSNAIRQFAQDLNKSFRYTVKALGFDTATHKVSNQRIKDLMKDEVHMRHAVFALLDEKGNVDVEHFDARLAIFDEARLTRGSSSILRANIESPGPAAIKSLQQEFVRMARMKVMDVARDEINAFYKANPDKIPATTKKDKQTADTYIQVARQFITQKYSDAIAAHMAYSGDANAKIDITAALKDFNGFIDSICAAAGGDEDLLSLIDQFVDRIAFNSMNEPRSLKEIKAKFIEPIRANLKELRTAADGNAAIVKAGVDALIRAEMTPFKKGVFTKLANGAKALNLRMLNSISDHPTSVEVAKAFTGMYAQFKKSITDADFNDPFSRTERDAYTMFFSGVVMSRLNNSDKERMVVTFASRAAGDASNIMQVLVTADDVDLSQKDVSNVQEAVNMMRTSATFIAEAFSIDPDAFAVNELDENITAKSIPDNVKNQFADLAKEIQG